MKGGVHVLLSRVCAFAAVFGALAKAQCSGLAASQVVSSVTQYNVTITFAAAVRVGQFANGDFWALGPVTIASTEPAFSGTRHGFEVNPFRWTQQGYDSRVSGFNASLVPALPFAVAGPASVVKAVSLDVGATTCRPCLKTAIVLTVLTALPPDDGHGSFRPAYFGTPAVNARSSRLLSEVNRSALPVVANDTLASMVSLATVERNYQRVQLDSIENWSGRMLHPSENMPDYGSDIAVQSATATIRLLFEDVDSSTCALTMFIQAGIDHFALLKAGMIWPANGGHCLGRKAIMIFASIVLQDSAMQQYISNRTEDGAFHEDTSLISTALGEPLWGALSCGTSEDAYWKVVRTGDGCRTYADPYKLIDGGPTPGGSYAFCCNNQANKGPALFMYLCPQARKVWNNENFYKYVARWVTFGAWAKPDTCAPIPGTCDNGHACSTAQPCDTGSCNYDSDGNGNGGPLYRVQYGPDGNGGCIQDGNSIDGIGRFPQRHGADKDGGSYSSALVNSAWNSLWQPDAPAKDESNNDANSEDSTGTAAAILAPISVVSAATILLLCAF